MSKLGEALKDYLAVRRSVGFQLRASETTLAQFVRFLEQEGACFITTDLALRWAQQPANAQRCWWAQRLSMVRCFAKYQKTLDPRTEIPPVNLLSARHQRKSPYIYSEREIDELLQAARKLPSKTGLRALTHSTILGLLVATGMRVSEAIHLDREDVDLTQGVLIVRQTKFKKSRCIPIHPSTQKALNKYQSQRDCLWSEPKTSRFFISETGDPVGGCSVRRTFQKLSRQIGLRGPSDSHGPRLHDLRHRFGVDVERHLPKLAAYLGHANVGDTYWYITAVPELLRLATLRLIEEPTQKGAYP